MVLIGLVLIAPWILFLIALYFVWKAGAFSKMRKSYAGAWRKAGIGDRVFRWRLRRCSELEEGSFISKYCTAGGRSLYMCKGTPVLDERLLTPETGDRMIIASFLSPVEVAGIMGELRPTLTVVDPVNAWLGGKGS